MGQITDLMMEEHGKINSFLNKFESSLKGSVDETKKQFMILQTELDMHFFLEEKAIFGLYDRLREDVGEIFDLMKEHGEIKEMFENIRQGLDKGVKSSVTGLKEKLTKHAEFENKIFYPKIDEDLNEQEKKNIVDKISELKGINE